MKNYSKLLSWMFSLVVSFTMLYGCKDGVFITPANIQTAIQSASVLTKAGSYTGYQLLSNQEALWVTVSYNNIVYDVSYKIVTIEEATSSFFTYKDAGWNSTSWDKVPNQAKIAILDMAISMITRVPMFFVITSPYNIEYIPTQDV